MPARLAVDLDRLRENLATVRRTVSPADIRPHPAF